MNSTIDILDKTVKYIESHLTEELSLDSIEKDVFVTKFHLERLFKRVTGFGIMEYITLRRLTLSVFMLTNSSSDIGFIANSHGFSSAQSYGKAFKRIFGTTPSAYRKSPTELKIFDTFNIELVRRCEDGCLIVPEIKVLPAFCVAGKRYEILAKDNIYREVGIKVATDFFFNLSKKIKKPVSYTEYFGVGLSPEYFTEFTDDKCVYYMPSLQVNDDSGIPDDMLKADIPSQKYAQFKYTGLHNILDINGEVFYKIWDYILFKWIPTVQYKSDGGCCFEHIDFTHCSDEYCEIDFYLSIC